MGETSVHDHKVKRETFSIFSRCCAAACLSNFCGQLWHAVFAELFWFLFGCITPTDFKAPCRPSCSVINTLQDVSGYHYALLTTSLYIYFGQDRARTQNILMFVVASFLRSTN